MDMNVSFGSAFLAGVLSFLSPCVLPLVPAYLSYLAGMSLDELRQNADQRISRRTIIAALVFVLGFSAIFIALGASASWLGQWLNRYSIWLGRISGLLLIILGLHLTGIIRIPFLMYEKRLQLKSGLPGTLTAFFIGAAFAFGWSPCIGPLLAGILALAGTKETITQGMTLLAVYSLGLGIPFILAAAGMNRFLAWMVRFRQYLHWVEVAAGILLLLLGIVMLTGQMMRLAGYFSFFSRFGL